MRPSGKQMYGIYTLHPSNTSAILTPLIPMLAKGRRAGAGASFRHQLLPDIELLDVNQRRVFLKHVFAVFGAAVHLVEQFSLPLYTC